MQIATVLEWIPKQPEKERHAKDARIKLNARVELCK